MAIEVTVRDTETGESKTMTVTNNYVLICAGTCHWSAVQAYPTKGTHVITIKGIR